MSATYQRTVVFENLNLAKVNRANHYNLYASGKAVNSARVLAQLEKDCAVTVCPLGMKNSAEFIELAQKDGLGLSWVDVPGKIRDCWTLLDTNAKTTTEIIAGEPVPQDDYSKYEIKLLKLITEKLDECDAMILAGSRQGIWPETFYSDICGIALDAKKVVLADFTGKDMLDAVQKAVPSIIKINDEEYERTFGEEASPENLCKRTKALKNIIIITRGSDSTLAADNGVFYECPALVITPVNTTACGDSFNAGFLYEYMNSHDIAKALEKGTWCAAQNAMNEAPGSL